jgi:hypothetical protein
VAGTQTQPRLNFPTTVAAQKRAAISSCVFQR